MNQTPHCFLATAGKTICDWRHTFTCLHAQRCPGSAAFWSSLAIDRPAMIYSIIVGAGLVFLPPQDIFIGIHRLD
jgi:hypothetical protein